jgi:hypothetical protein
MKFSFTFIFLGLWSAITQAQISLGGYRIAEWSGNKKAAAVITFDDNCPGQFDYALPALNARNLKSTFFIITGSSQCGMVDWAKVDSAQAKGHEIGSHSVNHINMANSDSLTIENELFASYQTLQTRYFPANWKLTIAYPFGRGGGSSAQDKRIRRIASKYYYGGRSAGIGPSGFTGYQDFSNPFYDRFYLQLGTYVMGPGNLPTGFQFGKILDSCISKGGLFTGLYHGIETGGFNNMPVSTFVEHLDTLKKKEGQLWITTFGKAVQYHAERRANPVLTASGLTANPNIINAYDFSIKLRDSLSEPWFKEPLTIRMGFSAPPVQSSFLGLPNAILEDDTLQFDITPGDSLVGTVVFTSVTSPLKPESSIIISPNPVSNGELLLSFPNEFEKEDCKVSLVQSDGKSFPVKSNWRSNQEMIIKNLDSFPNGLYFLKIQIDKSDGKVFFRKILIE